MDESCQLTFGEAKDHAKREWIYARYAAGDHLGTIAADAGLSANQVYDIMKSCPENYETTKMRREQFTGLRLIRSQSLLDAWNLRMLEDMDNEKVTVTPDIIKELVKLNKDLAHRVQLYEGKATEIVDMQTREKPLPLEEMERRIAAAKAAGDGIDMGSVEGEGLNDSD